MQWRAGPSRTAGWGSARLGQGWPPALPEISWLSSSLTGVICDANGDAEGKTVTREVGRRSGVRDTFSYPAELSLQGGKTKQGSIKGLNLGCKNQVRKYRKERDT